jgi:hypothetical protein
MSYTYNEYIDQLASGRVLEAEPDQLDSIPANFIHINDTVNNVEYYNWYNRIGTVSSTTGRGNYLYQVFDKNGNPMTTYN